jgi:hypothetical protein
MYAYMCVFAHSRFIENPPIRSWETNPSFLVDLTITHMVLVHERTALSIDALVTAHVLVVMIVSYVGLIFLL